MVNNLTLHPTTENDMIDVDDYEDKITGEVTGVVLEDDNDENMTKNSLLYIPLLIWTTHQ